MSLEHAHKVTFCEIAHPTCAVLQLRLQYLHIYCRGTPTELRKPYFQVNTNRIWLHMLTMFWKAGKRQVHVQRVSLILVFWNDKNSFLLHQDTL